MKRFKDIGLIPGGKVDNAIKGTNMTLTGRAGVLMTANICTKNNLLIAGVSVQAFRTNKVIRLAGKKISSFPIKMLHCNVILIFTRKVKRFCRLKK